MPQKSVTTPNEQKPRTVTQREVIVKKEVFPLKTLSQLYQYITKLKNLKQWTANFFGDTDKLVLNKMKSPSKVAEMTIEINDVFEYTISVFDWFLPEDHFVYSEYKRSIKNISVSNLVLKLESYFLCQGVDPSIEAKIVHHSVPQEMNEEENSDDDGGTFLIPFRN